MNGKLILSLLLVAALWAGALGQNVGVNTATPNSSASLDIYGTDKGLLIPRVSLSDVTDTTSPVNAPAEGLMVFNTNASVTGGDGVGFYFFNGTSWEKITTTSDGGGMWDANGNDIYNTNTGNVGIGTVNPNGALHIVDPYSDTALIVEPATGKYAARLNGYLDITGAIRNTGSLYDGSVAVNDGLTVGDLSGKQCSPNTPDSCSFSFVDTVGSFQIDPNESPWATSNYPTCSSGECRSITNVNFSATFFDYAYLAIKVDIYLNNQFQYKVLVNDANDTSWTFSFNTNDFNGQDPAGITNWSVLMSGYDGTGDSDLCEDYEGKIYYNWADSAFVSYYAAFGEVRASGTLYAHSTSSYGDVAEFFEVSNNIRQPEPGDIVSISANNAQTFSLTDQANDPLIAGVISANPSVFINNPDKGEPIALTGRVQVKVNMEGGTIKPGDPITSSSTLAEGMKMNTKGTIVGYALEAYDGHSGETGKIWILLDKGHYEKVAPITEVYAGESVNLGGIEVKGSKKVTRGIKEVFLPWSDMLKGDVPADIDFDDLVVDLNAFGGAANLAVSEVNANGVFISIAKPSKNFQGFYYTINLVSPSLYSAPGETNVVATTTTEPLDVEMNFEGFKTLYHRWENQAIALEQKSGYSFSDLPANLSKDKAKTAKQGILNAWASADRKGYIEYLKLGKQIQVMLNNPEISARVASSEKL